jgi:DNA-binding XRE family transcriptional regulator
MKKEHLLPLPVIRALKKFGADIRMARLKRGLTSEMMAERIGIHRTTYSKIENGDPLVGLGAYATALFVLGFGTPLGELIDQRKDDTGLLLDLEKLPKRIRSKKRPQGL